MHRSLVIDIADAPEIDAMSSTFEELTVRSLRLCAEVRQLLYDTRTAEALLDKRSRAVMASIGTTGHEQDSVATECRVFAGHHAFEETVRGLEFPHPFG